MINIKIDEEACVSCSLCVETCPTQVLSYDDGRDVPEVSEPQECFGCLSCSEVCPATAVAHEGVSRSESYYHDPYALYLASRLSGHNGLGLNVPEADESRETALGDLAARLLSVAWVLKDIMGNGLPVVGMLAGRTLANQLPRYQLPRDFNEVLELARREFSPAWQIESSLNGESLKLRVKDCFVRDICAKEGLDLGGELCTLFYNYLAGYLGSMGKARLKLGDATRGSDGCAYEVLFQG